MIIDYLSTVEHHLGLATVPEDVFGAAAAGAQSAYRTLAMAVHPDRNPHDQVRAAAVFSKLKTWWESAQAAIDGGYYGERRAAIIATITAGSGIYRLLRVHARGQSSVVYFADVEASGHHAPALVKIVNDIKDNDLMMNEARALTSLLKSVPAALVDTLPHVLSTFTADRRRGIAFQYQPTHQTAADILRAYPGGIDARDAVWMWKRMLRAVSIPHAIGIVHGALTPDHIVLDVADHGGFFVGWSAAVKSGERVKVADSTWRQVYAPEVFGKAPVTCSTDTYMIARTIVGMTSAASMPRVMRALLEGCLMQKPSARLDDAITLHRDIDRDVLPRFGPRVFRPFTMPPSPKTAGVTT